MPENSKINIGTVINDSQAPITINNKFVGNHPQTKLTKPKPKGLITLPRDKNGFFVEQSDIFKRIDEKLESHHLAYLHGTHGLGKTTTLVEYAYKKAESYDFILYVLATDAAIEGELVKFADDYVESVAADDTPALKLSKVKAYLENNERWVKESKNWLVIFDNLESEKQIGKYFPISDKGDCLYACNERLYIGNNHEVEFEQFTQAEADLFVYQRLNDVSEAKNEDITAESLAEYEKLIARLGRLPLALNIATAYLINTELSIDDYINLLAIKITKFLNYEDRHRASQHETVYAAFLVTLDKIANHNSNDEDGEIVAKLAETFLDLLVFCAPEDIPDELIEKTLFQTVDTSATTTPFNVLFGEIIDLLQNFGLVKRTRKSFKEKVKFAEPKTLADGTRLYWEEKKTDINVCKTYRTLQDVLSVKLETETKETLLKQFLVVFNTLLPQSEVTMREILSIYAIQAFPLVEQMKRSGISNNESWQICNKMGFYCQQIGKYGEAEYYYLFGKEIIESLDNKDYEAVATIYNNLAVLYRIRGSYEKAKPLCEQALSIRKKVLGKNHIDTASSYSNLAMVIKMLGKDKEAEFLFRRTLIIYEKKFGKFNHYTAQIYDNLASVLESQKKYEQAKPLYKKAIEINEKILGENDPQTAITYNDLALLYRKLYKLKESEKYFLKAKRIFEEHLGINHNWTATCYDNLALVYELQGRYDEAELLYNNGLTIMIKVLGEHHQYTARSYLSLGGFHYKRGNSEYGLELCEKALHIYRNALPTGHSSIHNCEEWVKEIKNSMGK